MKGTKELTLFLCLFLFCASFRCYSYFELSTYRDELLSGISEILGSTSDKRTTLYQYTLHNLLLKNPFMIYSFFSMDKDSDSVHEKLKSCIHILSSLVLANTKAIDLPIEPSSFPRFETFILAYMTLADERDILIFDNKKLEKFQDSLVLASISELEFSEESVGNARRNLVITAVIPSACVQRRHLVFLAFLSSYRAEKTLLLFYYREFLEVMDSFPHLVTSNIFLKNCIELLFSFEFFNASSRTTYLKRFIYGEGKDIEIPSVQEDPPNVQFFRGLHAIFLKFFLTVKPRLGAYYLPVNRKVHFLDLHYLDLTVKIQLKKLAASGAPFEVLLYPGIFSNIEYKFDISSIVRYELNIEASILEQIRINFAKFLRIYPRCTLRLNTTDTIFLRDIRDGLSYYLNRFCDPSDMVKYILQDGTFAHFNEILLLPIITTLRLHWNIVEVLFSNIQANFYKEIEVSVAAGIQTTKMTRNPAIFLRIINYIQGAFGEELALDCDYFVLFFLRQYFHAESIRRIPLNNSSDEGAYQDLYVEPFLAFFLQLLRDAEGKSTAASELRSEFAISFRLYDFFTELTRLPLPRELESKSLEIDSVNQLRQTIGLLKTQISLDVVGLFSCVQCFLIISEEYDKKTLFLSSPLSSETKKQRGIIKENHTDISSDPKVHVIRCIDRKLKNALKSQKFKKCPI